jgi:hypothetical protein
MNCNICNQHFISKSNFYNHNREIHTHNNCKNIKCNFCKNYYNIDQIEYFKNQLNNYVRNIEYNNKLNKLLKNIAKKK